MKKKQIILGVVLRSYMTISMLLVSFNIIGRVALAGSSQEVLETGNAGTVTIDNVGMEESGACPNLDLVFIMDTSNSMDDEMAALCNEITTITNNVSSSGVTLDIVDILQNNPYRYIDQVCTLGNIQQLYGYTTTSAPPACSILGNTEQDMESWALASAILAESYPWNTNNIRLIIPISDECPCKGGGIKEPCDQADTDSIQQAIQIASNNNVIVSPIIGAGGDGAAYNYATQIAEGTGGNSFYSTDASQIPGMIEELIRNACHTVIKTSSVCSETMGTYEIGENYNTYDVYGFPYTNYCNQGELSWAQIKRNSLHTKKYAWVNFAINSLPDDYELNNAYLVYEQAKDQVPVVYDSYVAYIQALNPGDNPATGEVVCGNIMTEAYSQSNYTNNTYNPYRMGYLHEVINYTNRLEFNDSLLTALKNSISANENIWSIAIGHFDAVGSWASGNMTQPKLILEGNYELDVTCENILPVLSVNDVTVGEWEGEASVAISLSESVDHTVEFTVSGFNGTAEGGLDYSNNIHHVSIPPNTSSTSVSFPVYVDDEKEDNEYFYVKVGAVCGALTGNTGTVTIIDTCQNDLEAPVLTGISNGLIVSCEDNIPDVPTVTATDNCDTNATWKYQEDVQNTENGYTITRTWMAQDSSGNVSSNSQVIMVYTNSSTLTVGVIPSAMGNSYLDISSGAISYGINTGNVYTSVMFGSWRNNAQHIGFANYMLPVVLENTELVSASLVYDCSTRGSLSYTNVDLYPLIISELAGNPLDQNTEQEAYELDRHVVAEEHKFHKFEVGQNKTFHLPIDFLEGKQANLFSMGFAFHTFATAESIRLEKAILQIEYKIKCEYVDCNTNGISDNQDIASGTSQDCNTNGIPDECEVFAISNRTPEVNGQIADDEYTHLTEVLHAQPIAGVDNHSDFKGESSASWNYDEDGLLDLGNNSSDNPYGRADVQGVYLSQDATNLYLAITGPSVMFNDWNGPDGQYQGDKGDLFIALDTSGGNASGSLSAHHTHNSYDDGVKSVDFEGWTPTHFIAVQWVENGAVNNPQGFADIVQAGVLPTQVAQTIESLDDNGFSWASGFNAQEGGILEFKVPWALIGGSLAPGEQVRLSVYTTGNKGTSDTYDSAPGMGNQSHHEQLGDAPYDTDTGGQLGASDGTSETPGSNPVGLGNYQGPGHEDEVDTIEEYFAFVIPQPPCQDLCQYDVEPPQLIGVPSNQVVSCDETISNVTVTAIDNCDENPPVFHTWTETTNPCAAIRYITNTWKATDTANNSTTATQVITVDCSLLDCDNNGIIDSCDIANDPDLDCNTNNLIDSCEISDDPTLDSNGDGLLDECDCNGNGVIDAEEYSCLPLDMVFVIDTSGSMRWVLADLCTEIEDIKSSLISNGVPLGRDIILRIATNANVSPNCSTGSVTTLLGTQVPGSDNCGPLYDDPVNGQCNEEMWAAASSVIAERYDWKSNHVRMIVPISDTVPCGCDNFNSMDNTNSILNAIQVANSNNVVVSPIVANNNSSAKSYADLLAEGTHGSSYYAHESGIADAIAQVVQDACTYASDCNSNSVLDECELDTDDDGVIDDCDADDDNDGCPDEDDPSPKTPGFNLNRNGIVDGQIADDEYTYLTEVLHAQPIAGVDNHSDFLGESSALWYYEDGLLYLGTNSPYNPYGRADVQGVYLSQDATNLYLAITGPSVMFNDWNGPDGQYQGDKGDLFIALDTSGGNASGSLSAHHTHNSYDDGVKSVDFEGWTPTHFIGVQWVENGAVNNPQGFADIVQAGVLPTQVAQTIESLDDNGFSWASGFNAQEGGILEFKVPWALIGGLLAPGEQVRLSVYTTGNKGTSDTYDSAPGIGNQSHHEQLGDAPYDTDTGGQLGASDGTSETPGSNPVGLGNYQGPGHEDEVDTIEEYFAFVIPQPPCQDLCQYDVEPPQLIGVPSNQVVSCDETISNVTVTAIDNCDENPPVFHTWTETTNPCAAIRYITNTWKATDTANNSTTAIQVITKDCNVLDCDNNGVIDSCDISNDPNLDCNTNNLIDSCEIADDPSLDGNNDGLLDECDCNENGTPDKEETSCPNIDLVFIIDTSGSMSGEMAALCNNISTITNAVSSSGITLGVVDILRNNPFTRTSTDCTMGNIQQLYGNTITSAPPACSVIGDTESDMESWALASAILAESYPWNPSNIRLIIPISDECPCLGGGFPGEPCDQNDANSIQQAIQVASNHNVIVSPIIGNGGDGTAFTYASQIAQETGGRSFFSTNTIQVPDMIIQLIMETCTAMSDCNTNGILDDCELDTDDDGVIDDCDADDDNDGCPDEDDPSPKTPGFNLNRNGIVDGQIADDEYTYLTEVLHAQPIAGVDNHSDFLGESSALWYYEDGLLYLGTNSPYNPYGRADVQGVYLSQDATNLYLAITGPSVMFNDWNGPDGQYQGDKGDLFIALDTSGGNASGSLSAHHTHNSYDDGVKSVDFEGWTPTHFIGVQWVENGAVNNPQGFADIVQAGVLPTQVAQTIESLDDNGFSWASGFNAQEGGILEFKVPWALIGGSLAPGEQVRLSVYTTGNKGTSDTYDSAPGMGNQSHHEQLGDAPYDTDTGGQLGASDGTSETPGSNPVGLGNYQGPGHEDEVDTIEEYFAFVIPHPPCQAPCQYDMEPPTLEGVPDNLAIACDAEYPPAPTNVTAVDNCDADVTIEMIEDDTYSESYITRLWIATDDAGNSVTNARAIIKMCSFADWVAVNNLSGEMAKPMADADGDGMVNLLEYALNDPQESMVLHPGYENNPGSNWTFKVGFELPETTPPDITYILQHVDQLPAADNDWQNIASKTGVGNWTPAEYVDVQQGTPGNEFITVKIPKLQQSIRGFARLKIILQD